ncbi:MAG: hypothetical protein WD294_02625 [Phycisphaeraceae bacterium]
MSSIANTAIAASVAQGAHHQGQVARVQDAARNQAARQSSQLKQAREKHLESVEDIDAVSGVHPVAEDEAQQHRQPTHPEHGPDGKGSEEGEPPPRVDVTA